MSVRPIRRRTLAAGIIFLLFFIFHCHDPPLPPCLVLSVAHGHLQSSFIVTAAQHQQHHRFSFFPFSFSLPNRLRATLSRNVNKPHRRDARPANILVLDNESTTGGAALFCGTPHACRGRSDARRELDIPFVSSFFFRRYNPCEVPCGEPAGAQRPMQMRVTIFCFSAAQLTTVYTQHTKNKHKHTFSNS